MILFFRSACVELITGFRSVDVVINVTSFKVTVILSTVIKCVENKVQDNLFYPDDLGPDVIRINKNPDNRGSVSYTHLDVYKRQHLQIANIYGHNYMTELIHHTKEWTKKQIHNIQTKHDRKIKNLTPINTNIIPSHKFYPRTVNLTDITITIMPH